MTTSLRVLISGTGIAGPTAAYWLSKIPGAQVTMIENADKLRDYGQGIDLRGEGIEVIRRMGVEDIIRSQITGEEGLAIVDEYDRPAAVMGIDSDKGITSEIEISRGELVKILCHKVENLENVTTKFSTSIVSIQQSEKDATVEFNDGSVQTYDLVIGADGLGSKVRKMAFSEYGSRDAGMVPFGMYVAYFSMPHEPQDSPYWRWYSAPGRRTLSTRPRDKQFSTGYVSIIQDRDDLRAALTQSSEKQKALLTDIFSSVGWQSKRMLKAMNDADDFYFAEIGQVKLSTWTEGHCTLIGDAGYCPSPMSGMGTTLAIVGAYLVAHEIAKSPHDVPAALKAYEDSFRPYVTKVQHIPGGMLLPKIVNPQTAFGCWLLLTILRIANWTGLIGWLTKGVEPQTQGFELPSDDFVKQ